MNKDLYNLLYKILKAFDEPYGFESNTFYTGMEELEDLIADGYCGSGDDCRCGGDAKGVQMSCSRWVKPNTSD